MHYINWVVLSAVAAFPVLSIVLHNAGNACLLLLLLCSIAAAVCRYEPAGFGFIRLLKEYWPLHAAMAAPFGTVLLNQLSRGHFDGAPFDRALRLLLFAPVLWVILTVPLRHLKIIQWSFVLGVLAASIKAYVVTEGGAARPGNIGFLPIIAYTNITLVLGAFAMFSTGWNESREKFAIASKILVFCIALYVTILTKTRGSWITIPAILAFASVFFGNIRIRYKSLIAVSALVLLTGLFATSSTVQGRIADARADITQYMDGAVDTSLGIRLQLWQGSWILFKEHPMFGVGRENFKEELKELASRKIITPTAAEFVHSHNELLFNMAILGVPGLIAILSVYFVPAFYFAREMRHTDQEIRTAAGLGLLLCLCFFFYGLVDLMFFWNVTGSFYAMSVATFLALIIKHKEEIKQTWSAESPPPGRQRRFSNASIPTFLPGGPGHL